MMISNKEDKVLWREAVRLRSDPFGKYNHEEIVNLVFKKRRQLIEKKLQDHYRRQIQKKSI